MIPPIGPHTTFYYKYNEVPIENVSPAPSILDVPSLRTVSNVAFLETTLTDFARAHQNTLGGTWRVVERSKLREKIEEPWSADDITTSFFDEPAQFLYFSKGTMWRCFNFSREEMEPVMRAVRFHPMLRTTARRVAETLEPFNALHIRFSDGESNKVRVDWLKPSSTFLARMRFAKFHDYSPNLFIATVPSRQTHPYFNKIKAAYNVTFSSAILPHPLVKRALAGFPEPMKVIVLGVIEQHVCARAFKFLGTGFSTFSEHIREMRRWRAIAFDPDALSEDAAPAVRRAEEKFLAMKTPCERETRPC